MLDAMTGQLAQPRGLVGRIVGRLMDRRNRAMQASALSALSVHRGDRVLEIGFGGGATLATLLRAVGPGGGAGLELSDSVAEHGPGGVAGLELSDTMVERARSHYRDALDEGRLELRLGSVEHLPFSNECFDEVLTINTIYFWQDAARALGEIHRVLRPGGRLVLAFRPKHTLQRAGAGRHGFALRENAEVQALLQDAHLRLIALDQHEDGALGYVIAVAEKAARAG